MNRIALQMYSLHRMCEQDFGGTLGKVAETGFEAVELAGSFGKTAAELKELLEQNGLKAVSAHVGFDVLAHEFERETDYALAIGCPRLVTPGVPADCRQDAIGWKKGAQLLNELGEKLKQKGLSLGYQNHDFEFQGFDGRRALEILLEHTDPELVFFELETFWADDCGVNPARLIRRFPGRFKALHIKDRKERESLDNTELGRGVIDIPRIVAAGEAAGNELFIVKQENFARPPLESIAESLRNMKELLAQ